MKINYINIDNSLVVSIMNRAIFNSCRLANYKGNDVEFEAAAAKIAARSSNTVTIYLNLQNEPLFATDLCYNPYNIKVTSAGKDEQKPTPMTIDKLNKSFKKSIKDKTADYETPVFAFKKDYSLAITGVFKNPDIKDALILNTSGHTDETIKTAALIQILNNSLKSNKILIKIGSEYFEVMFLDDTMEKALELSLFDAAYNSPSAPLEVNPTVPVAAYTYHPEDAAMEHVLRAYIAKKFGKDEIAKKHMDYAMDHFSNIEDSTVTREDIKKMVNEGKELFHDMDEDELTEEPTKFEGIPEDREIGEYEISESAAKPEGTTEFMLNKSVKLDWYSFDANKWYNLAGDFLPEEIANSAGLKKALKEGMAWYNKNFPENKNPEYKDLIIQFRKSTKATATFQPELNEMFPKPTNLDQIIASDLEMKITPEIEALPKLKEDSLYENPESWTIGDDFKEEAEAPRIFVMETKKGDVLVDTQGYNYPRYAVKLTTAAMPFEKGNSWAPIIKLIEGGMGIMEALESEFGSSDDELLDQLYEDFLTANPKYMQDEIEKEALSAVGKDEEDETVGSTGSTKFSAYKSLKTFKSVKESNEFLEKNPEYGVLGEEGKEDDTDYKVYVALNSDMGDFGKSTAGNAPVVHNEVLLKGKEPSFANPGWRASTYTLKVYELPTLDHVAGRDKTVCYKAKITYDPGYPDGSGIRDVLNKGRIDTPFVGVKTKEEAVKLAKEAFNKMNISVADVSKLEWKKDFINDIGELGADPHEDDVVPCLVAEGGDNFYAIVYTDMDGGYLCDINGEVYTDFSNKESAKEKVEEEFAKLGESTAVHPSEKGASEIKLQKIKPQHLEKLAEYANTGILKHSIISANSDLKPEQVESVKKALIAVGNRNLGHERMREEGKEGVIAGTDIPEFAVWISSDCMGETADYLNDNIGDKNAKDTYAFAFERFEKCLMEFYKTEMNKSNFGDKLAFWENLIYSKKALGSIEPGYVAPEHKLADEQNANLSHQDYNCKAICDIYPDEETVKFHSLNAEEVLTKVGDAGKCYTRCGAPCVMVDGVEFCYDNEEEFLEQWEMLPELKYVDVLEITEQIGNQMPVFLEQKPDLTEASNKAIAKDPSLQPPKKWFNKMHKEIKEGNPSYSEEQIVETIGNIWYHELNDAKRSEIRGREGKSYGGKESTKVKADNSGYDKAQEEYDNMLPPEDDQDEIDEEKNKEKAFYTIYLKEDNLDLAEGIQNKFDLEVGVVNDKTFNIFTVDKEVLAKIIDFVGNDKIIEVA